MKKALWLSLAALAAVWLFALGNSAVMSGHTTRWQRQLDEVRALVRAEDWPAASAALAESRRDWSRRQTYLRMVTGHGAVDEAGAIYCRAIAFASIREQSELLAELAGLSEQLRLLAEMERLSIGNVL